MNDDDAREGAISIDGQRPSQRSIVVTSLAGAMLLSPFEVICYNGDVLNDRHHKRNTNYMENAILGGGALGLMTAYRLAKAGQPVMVLEQETTAGGLAAGFRAGDSWLEKFYHHLFRSDTYAIKLIEELGLGDRLEWSRPRTVSLVGGQIHQLDSPMTLLSFTPWRIDERLRVGAVVAFIKVANPAWLEGKTAAAWLRRWMGKRPYEMVFEQLFVGKFGAMHDQIALPWFWARFHDRTTSLGYLRGGFQLL